MLNENEKNALNSLVKCNKKRKSSKNKFYNKLLL